MAMRSRNAGREFAGQTVLQWTIELRAEKAVNFRLVRTYSSGGQVQGKREQKFASKIDLPEKVPDGTAVWLLQKDELIRLITTNVGGWKLTIHLSKATDGGWSCKATYERFQEVGKGHNRNLGVERGAQGQVIEILSASQIRSNCTVDRNVDQFRATALATALIGRECVERLGDADLDIAAGGSRHAIEGAAEIETYNDHRIAMCFGMLGLRVPDIRLRNPACVRKTFPNFFPKLAELGALIRDGSSGNCLSGDDLLP